MSLPRLDFTPFIARMKNHKGQREGAETPNIDRVIRSAETLERVYSDIRIDPHTVADRAFDHAVLLGAFLEQLASTTEDSADRQLADNAARFAIDVAARARKENQEGTINGEARRVDTDS